MPERYPGQRQDRTGRARAERLFPVLGPCEHCGEAPAAERHHIDGDPMNNDRTNVLLVCRACHGKLDGRDADLGEMGRRRSAAIARERAENPRLCRVCGQPANPLRRGLCHKCHMREWRRGRA